MLYVYVVVNFSSQVIFLFLLFWGMVMYANEVETKEKEKLPEIKKLTTTYTFLFFFKCVICILFNFSRLCCLLLSRTTHKMLL